MLSPFHQLLRSRWFALCVHAGLWFVLVVSLVHLGGKVPDLKETQSMTAPLRNPVPVGRLAQMFNQPPRAAHSADTNHANPFFTRYFVPPPTPAPPPPTTRKVDVTYQGFYQSGESIPSVVVQLPTGFVIARVGTSVTTNLYVAQAAFQQLVLTNSAGQTNLLRLNVKQEVEVPLR